MRILIAIWSIQIGGAETFAVELCRYLKERGYQPYLFPIVGPWDRKYYKYIRSLGIPILSPFKNNILDWIGWKLNALSLKLRSKSLRDFLIVYYFRKAIRRYKIKLIISNAYVADQFVHKNLTEKTPYIVIEHGEYSYAVVDNRQMGWNALMNANEIVYVSKWCKEILSTIKLKVPSTIIYNGHNRRDSNNTQPTQHFKSDEFIFGLVGRGIAYKGWEEAIQAYMLVKKQYPKCKLVLIGEGSFLRDLENKYREVPDILFTGRLTNPLEMIASINVGLVPSRLYEAFGIVILDFFSQGKPVIGSNIGGIPEIIHYGNKAGGVLIPVDNEGKAVVEALADKMIMLMTDEEAYRAVSSSALEIYKEFSFERTGNEYEKLIKRYL